jgi:hypothetical protein
LTYPGIAGTIPAMSRDVYAIRDTRSFGAFFFRGYFGA